MNIVTTIATVLCAIAAITTIISFIMKVFARSQREKKEKEEVVRKTSGMPSLLWLTATAYAGFTLFLLYSTPEDRKSGYLFLINVFVLIIGSVVASVNLLQAFYVTAIVGVIQIGIMVIMLLQGTASPRDVILINFIIFTISCTLFGFYYKRRVAKRIHL